MSAKELETTFHAYCKFGNAKSDAKTITLSNTDKWMKEAKVIDGKQYTTTDTGIEFKKFKTQAIDFKQFQQFIENLAKAKKIDPSVIIEKLAACTAPGTSGTTSTAKSGAVDRLTDTSKYTGTHKERFDDKGKGKGLAGRTDDNKNDGYVQGYKNKDTYDKDHNPPSGAVE